MNTLKRWTNPQAIKDLDRFLDALPLNVGYNALIAAGMAWIIAGVTVFFTVVESGRVSELRAELMKVEALKPPIPVLTYSAPPQKSLQDLQDKIKETYTEVGMVISGNQVTLSASDTQFFPEFLAAVNYLQNGGKNWRVQISSMCVGRDCTGSKLSAIMKVEMVRVDNPPRDAGILSGEG
ncbi:MAG: hypothetical protein OXT65_02685 [Alphaproteobacteria bacterium]|nr:hypothetical protein [Alphaproteobacteria bacterium]